MKRTLLLSSLCLTVSAWSQTWTAINCPSGCDGFSMFQLTDGSILVGSEYTAANCRRWFRYKPSATGSYTTGTWTEMAQSPHGRLYFACSVLADGRIPMFGGEYLLQSGSLNAVWTTFSEIYNPDTNTWSTVTPPAGWSTIGDGSCVVLPDGRFMFGNASSSQTAIFNPSTNTNSAGPGLVNKSNEEGWTLLWNGDVIVPDAVTGNRSERYDLSTNDWVWDGDVPVALYTASSKEPGAGVTLHDGRVFHTGGTGSNALYTPGRTTGSWKAAASFPKISGIQQGAEDGMALTLPNGIVMCVANRASSFTGPTHLYLYNPDNDTMAQMTDPLTGIPNPCYTVHLLQLPTGQVALSQSNGEIWIYSGIMSIDPAIRPKNIYAPPRARPGDDIMVAGEQINGLSQGAIYGDEGEYNTNFPLVRLRSSGGNVYYARTHDHSTMAIGPYHGIQNTNAELPTNIPKGTYDLEVVANGVVDSTGKTISIDPTYNMIYGKVTLLDWTDRTEEQGDLFDVDLVNATTNAVAASQTIRTKEDGSYEYITSLEGTYYLRFKTSHWLSKKTSSFTLSGPTTVSRSLSLLNGDIDGDNSVTVFDYSILSDYFDRDEFHAGWKTVGPNGFRPYDADIDGDGSVSVFDYAVISDNFDKSGT